MRVAQIKYTDDPGPACSGDLQPRFQASLLTTGLRFLGLSFLSGLDGAHEHLHFLAVEMTPVPVETFGLDRRRLWH